MLSRKCTKIIFPRATTLLRQTNSQRRNLIEYNRNNNKKTDHFS